MDILCYVIAGLSVAFGLVTAVFYYMGKSKEAFITKMLAAMSFIIAGIFAISVTSMDRTTAALIVIGMLISSWGDFFLARKEMSKITSSSNFEYGVVAFSVAQVLFSVAYLSIVGFEFNYYLLPIVLVGTLIVIAGKFSKLMSFTSRAFYTSIIYGLFLSLTLATTINRYMILGDTASMVALIGACSFLLSDGILGLYYFSNVKCKKYLHFPIMLFYFAAEAMYAIALIL